jgi:hypothetical protein
MVRKERESKRATTVPVKKKVSAKSPAARSSSGVGNQSAWQAEVMSRVRKLILQADRKATEERKWKKPSTPAGVPVWSHNGIICTGESYKTYVKLTFAKGAALKDPSRLFNASLEGNTRRAIDIGERDKINEKAFKELIRAAVQLNDAGDD